MKKPLTESTSVPLQGILDQRSYRYPGLQPWVAWTPSQRLAGGTTSEIVRSGGYKEPLREKGYKRTFLSATTANGDVSWVSRSPWGDVSVERWNGPLSTASGTSARLQVQPDIGYNPAFRQGFFNRYSISTPAVSLDLLSQAEVKCLNKLRQGVGSPDLSFGTLFGERRETCQMIESLLGGTWNLMRAIAFKDYSRSASVLKDTFSVPTTAARERRRLERIERRLKRELGKAPSHAQRAVAGAENAILGYNLGISPLVKDVKAATAALAQGDIATGFDIKATARYSRDIEDRIEWFADNDPRDRTCKWTATASETHGYTVTLVATPKWDNWTLFSRLGIADYSLAWELTSLSFLVDYYLAVGPWLSALNAHHEFIWRDGSYSQRLIRIVTVKGTSKLIGAGRASGNGVVNHMHRRLYTKFPVPAPPMSRRIRNLSSQDAQDAEAKRALNQAALASRNIRDALGGIFRG